MANVAATSLVNARTPWVNEPACGQCHTNVPGVDTGGQLFRNANGHGNMACVACHNSPHAMLPSSQAMDSYTAAKYQGTAAAQKAIGSCGACHSSNHGEGFSEWASEHGATGTATESACNVCHTGFQNPVQANFPHGFKWNARTSTVGSGPVKNLPVVETPMPTPTPTPTLAITAQPQSRTVTAGQTATFTVSATAATAVSYQWRKNGTAIAGANGASCTTPATTLADNGAAFTVVASANGASVTSQAAVLTVVAATAARPVITTQPTGQRVRVGRTAVFFVGATGTAPLTYQWYKNGAAVANATSATYSFVVARSDRDALIYVKVANPYGAVQSNTVRLRIGD
jgi:hypothetical protein